MARSPLTLVAVGDVIPTRALFRGDNPVTEGFGRVSELVSGADVAVGTLDSALTTRGTPREKLIHVRAEPSVAADLRRFGLDVISVANNHSMDYGDVGMADTLDALSSAGVAPIGGGSDLKAATAPAVFEVNGWRVGVIAWTCVLPTGAAAAPGRTGQAPLHVHVAYEVNPYLVMEEPTTPPTVRTRVDDADLEAATAAIAELRTRADFVVVLVHWGGGLSDELAEYQRPLGHALVDAGADLVVGSHPHRILGIETYKGGAIMYSPGTLIEQLSREGLSPEIAPIFELLSPDSFVAELKVSPDGGYAIRITPTTLNADGVPEPAEGEALERITERLVRMSADLDTSVDVTDDGLVVRAGAPVPA